MTKDSSNSLAPEEVRRIFIGLMLGMLAAALNLTIVSPALPRIVAELGGMDHYSWIALSAALASAVVVPVVGKLGDLYGRKPFYLGGLVLFMAASALSGMAQTFWWLVGARVVQGFGMGMLMPLSQAIVGDIAPPRERGKYQGLIGMAFGLASVSGPPLGGMIAQAWSWRWLFFLNLPVGIVAIYFIARFLHLPQARRQRQIDYPGMVTLTAALVCILLATSWGGTRYPWASPHILGMYGVGAVMLLIFLFTQRRAPEPVIPLYLWRNPVFATACLASMTLAMGMFGAIYFVPMFSQGVLGLSIAQSGMVLVPMDAALISVGVVNGFLISRTGRFKPQMLLGLPLMAAGFYALRSLGPGAGYAALLPAMVGIGIGIGSAMQTYTVVVQAAVPYRDLGVATSAIQFFRNVGNTVGTALLGTMLASNFKGELPRFLPTNLSADALQVTEKLTSGDGVSALFDPVRLASLPPQVADGVRQALEATFQPIFGACVVFVGLTFFATVFLKAIPLRSERPEGSPAVVVGAQTQGATPAHHGVARVHGWAKPTGGLSSRLG